MSKHTPEPWYTDDHMIMAQLPDGRTTVASCNSAWGAQEANAQHIVDCVNALAGLNPTAIKLLLEEIKRLLDDLEHDDQVRDFWTRTSAVRRRLEELEAPK